MRAASQRSQPSTVWLRALGRLGHRRAPPRPRPRGAAPRRASPATTTYSRLRMCDTVPTSLARRVVDADLRAHVAARVEAAAPRRGRAPRTCRAARRALTHDSSLYDSTTTRARTSRDHPRERVGHLAPAVERALGRGVARVDALARHAVVLGRVPRHQRLPHVVVREVAVLVVRRVEVGEVDTARASARASSASPRTAAPGPASSSGTRSSSGGHERGAHCFT